MLFLDADDLLEPDAIADIVGHWQPGAAKLQYELKVIDGEGDWTGRVFCNYPEGYGADTVRDEFQRHATYVWPVMSAMASGSSRSSASRNSTMSPRDSA